MKLVDLLPWIAYAFPAVITIAGILAYRQSAAKSADEIQKRVIEALKLENEELAKRVKRCEEEAENLRERFETLQTVLKSRGITVHVDGQIVTIQDDQGTHATRRTKRQPPTPGRDSDV